VDHFTGLARASPVRSRRLKLARRTPNYVMTSAQGTLYMIIWPWRVSQKMVLKGKRISAVLCCSRQNP